MNILFIVEDANLHGGTEILTFNLLEALSMDGIVCKILSLVPYKGECKNVVSLSQNDYNKWNSVRNSFINHISFGCYSDRILKEILRREIRNYSPKLVVNQTYDIITSLPREANIAQVFNWSILGYESSLKYHLSKKIFFMRILSSFLNKVMMIRRRSTIHKIQRLVVLTNSAKDELCSINKKVSNSKISVIPDPLLYSGESNIISRLNNNNIIFVGRLSHEKGVMRMLRIWKRISETLSGYTLSIYGDGPARVEMEDFIKRNKIEGVILKGFCNNIDDIYPHADLLCMTSDTEGFGMVLIEAMYYGVPCISFDCAVSPKEIISDAGVIVPAYDEDVFADSIIKLLQNPQQMNDYQGRAIQRAKDFYIDKVVKQWELLLNS